MGISEDGGLFVPDNIQSASFPMDKLLEMSDSEISATVLSLLFSGGSMFSGDKQKFSDAIESAYKDKFENSDYAPIAKVGDAFVMELYHGPTCAFKDVALQLLPHLILESKKS